MALRTLTNIFHELTICGNPQIYQQVIRNGMITSWFHTSSILGGVNKFRNPDKYTVKPIGFNKTGGRDHTGRIRTHGRGGGRKQCYRMMWFKRTGPTEGAPLEEKVIKILYDPNRTAKIALIAGGNHKRYITATVNMKPGDIIKTSGHIGRIAVSAYEGDAHPLGALPIGTLVNSVEIFPGHGATIARAAGTCCQIVRKAGGQVIVQMPSKQQISVSERCMVTVGRVSNPDHNKLILGKAGALRNLGWRPQSGWWQRKGGWAGRKIRPLPPIKVYLDPKRKGTHIDL
ncbi:large ribosomal subunit protein uL2m-like [Saccoglossus kowalevskii]|uniref:39S ribosomal protein L2, mitochondrial-like isoform X1 n=1 Tax=Saccoglossus kowalevskii TaxID=10224 RepID=A0ABM0GX57_SACKO|nr:PREDICTED: 39S ribosomal protein L2, mitochondrial-like isoform X1 [Saccoglossus kowalevskii]XP_006822204.1 PREDICTED: 39S ribosomal protein L2, mitochondrial-like isoform X2 [Saccoglossus kowalevskii]